MIYIQTASEIKLLKQQNLGLMEKLLILSEFPWNKDSKDQLPSPKKIQSPKDSTKFNPRIKMTSF